MGKYNFDEIIDRSDSNSQKYDAGRVYNPYLPDEYIPMWVADMDFAVPQPILDAMKARIDKRILGYANYTSTLSDGYFDAISSWLKRRHSVEAKRENIAFFASIINASREAIAQMSSDGDGVMYFVPGYPWITETVKEFNRKIVQLPLKHDDTGYYTIDFDAFEQEAKKIENTLLIFINPHNPSGRVWTEEELRKLTDICFDNNVRIFVDEVHGDLTRSSVKTISQAALYPNDPRIVTANAISKSFNCAWNNHSYVLTYDAKLKAAFDDSRYSGSMNALSVEAIIAAYNECEEWLDELREYIDGNIEYLDQYLRENLPRVKFCKPEATYLCWIDLSAYGMTEEELFRTISAAGLYLEYASDFIANADGFARMNLACPRSTVEKACEILKKALEG